MSLFAKKEKTKQNKFTDIISEPRGNMQAADYAKLYWCQ